MLKKQNFPKLKAGYVLNVAESISYSCCQLIFNFWNQSTQQQLVWVSVICFWAPTA